MDKPSLTLLTTPSQKQTERRHPIETRPLQILEYARIQTFPDDYKFFGGSFSGEQEPKYRNSLQSKDISSVNQIYKQIGNAVPVNLAKSISKQIRIFLLN